MVFFNEKKKAIVTDISSIFEFFYGLWVFESNIRNNGLVKMKINWKKKYVPCKIAFIAFYLKRIRLKNKFATLCWFKYAHKLLVQKFIATKLRQIL